MKFVDILLLFSCVTMLCTAETIYSNTTTEQGEVKVSVTYDVAMSKSLYNLDAMQLINVDSKNRIIGSMVLPARAYDSSHGVKAELSYNNITYTYVNGHRGSDKFNPKAKWFAVLYIRPSYLHVHGCKKSNCDNEIFYGIPNFMRWDLTHYQTSQSDALYDIYKEYPFVFTQVSITYKKGTKPQMKLFQHKKEPISTAVGYKPSDWIANHGIYKLMDTRDGATDPKTTVYQHNLYYPPIQQYGSYFT